MRILITGGAGFIGAALTRALIARGHHVTCLDLAPGERLAPLRDAPDFGFVAADVRDEARLRPLVEACDFVFHLAAVVGVDEYSLRPEEVLDVNIAGTRAVMAACLHFDRPLIFSSSSEVYGANCGLLNEVGGHHFGNLANSRWSYGLSKAIGEQYAVALARQGLRYAILRYFNVYGPLMDSPGKGRVISKFLGYLQERKPLPLVDGGQAVRCYCWIDDAIEATLRLFTAVCEGRPEALGRAFNIGRPDPLSVRELAKRMLMLAGQTQGTQTVSGRDFFGRGFEEIPHRVPDVRALREVLGYEAPTTLNDGLARVLSHWGLLAPEFERPERRALAGLSAPALLPFVRPCLENNPQLMATLDQALDSGRVTNFGRLATRFESELAAFLRCEEALLVSSASMALLLGLRALNLAPGKVILPSFTYLSTLSAVVNAGFAPVFCDIEPDTWTLCPRHLAELLRREPDIRAVLAVNSYGVPPKLSEIAALAQAHGALLLYDNAHGMGSEQAGQRLSALPEFTVFSLHATKLLPAIEGGLLAARDPKLLERARRLANHGFAPDPLDSGFGYNAKMSELHAAVGSNALAALPDALARRRSYADRLRAALAAEGEARFGLQRIPQDVVSNHQNLAVRCRFAEDSGLEAAIADFARSGIEVRRYFHPPLHHLRRFGAPKTLPVTEAVCRELVCLPLYSRMNEAELSRIERAIARVGRAR